MRPWRPAPRLCLFLDAPGARHFRLTLTKHELIRTRSRTTVGAGVPFSRFYIGCADGGLNAPVQRSTGGKGPAEDGTVVNQHC